MRILLDAGGVEWTVFEVRRRGPAEKMSYLPERFGEGWLCFESDVGKRRLTPIPSGWRELGEEDMLRLLTKATPVNRGRESRDRRTSSEGEEPRA